MAKQYNRLAKAVMSQFCVDGRRTVADVSRLIQAVPRMRKPGNPKTYFERVLGLAFKNRHEKGATA